MAPNPWHPLMRGECIVATLGDVTYGGLAAVFQALSVGAASVRASRDRLETLNLINLNHVNRITTTAGILSEMIDVMDEKAIACPTLRHIALVGSLVDEFVVRRIAAHFDADIAMIYGATEVGRLSCGPIDPQAFEPGYVGDVFPEVRFVGSGSPSDPAPFAVIRDPATHAPYYAKGAIVQNDETFYTLPDIGYVRGNRVYIVGRDDEVLNVSGNKIAYSTIETGVRRLAGVRDVAIVSAATLGDPSGIVIAVVAEAGADMDPLRRAAVAVVKAPGAAEHVRVVALDAIPRNAFGKIDRVRIVGTARRS